MAPRLVWLAPALLLLVGRLGASEASHEHEDKDSCDAQPDDCCQRLTLEQSERNFEAFSRAARECNYDCCHRPIRAKDRNARMKGFCLRQRIRHPRNRKFRYPAECCRLPIIRRSRACRGVVTGPDPRLPPDPDPDPPGKPGPGPGPGPPSKRPRPPSAKPRPSPSGKPRPSPSGKPRPSPSAKPSPSGKPPPPPSMKPSDSPGGDPDEPGEPGEPPDYHRDPDEPPGPPAPPPLPPPTPPGVLPVELTTSGRPANNRRSKDDSGHDHEDDDDAHSDAGEELDDDSDN